MVSRAGHVILQILTSLLAAFALVLPFSLVAVSATDEHLYLIVNDSSDVLEVSVDELRAIYSLQKQNWPDGSPLTVFVRDVDGSLHRQFCRDILKVYPHQLQKGWDRMEYTGRARVPTVVRDNEKMLQLVRDTPGAIGYLSEVEYQNAIGSGIRIIQVSE